MVAVSVDVLRGEPAKLASLSGSGYGSGYGYGSGDGSGYGSGSGSGDGSGDGDGSGYGSGYGYGSGDGSGYGSGSGSGYGSGDGDGSGYGSGYGSGSGSGDGSGSGSGSKEYWLATVPYFAAKWTDEQRARIGALQAEGVPIAFWRSNASGLPANGGSSRDAAKPGLIEEVSGPLEICSRRALHATFIPPKWKGERWWIVAMHGDVQQEDDKIGSLKREILGEAL